MYFSGTILLRKQTDRPNYRSYEFQQVTLSSPLGKHILDGSVVYDTDRPQYNVDLKGTYGKSKYILVQGGYKNGTGNEKETSAQIGFLSSQYPHYGFKYTYNTKDKNNMVNESLLFPSTLETKFLRIFKTIFIHSANVIQHSHMVLI